MPPATKDAATQLKILAYTYVSLEEMKAFARFPLRLEIDGTESTDNQGLTWLRLNGVSAVGKMNPMLYADITSENEDACIWVIGLVAPLVYGYFLAHVRRVRTDKGPGLVAAVTVALRKKLYGRGNALQGLCSRHLVLGKFQRIKHGIFNEHPALGQLYHMVQYGIAKAATPGAAAVVLAHCQRYLETLPKTDTTASDLVISKTGQWLRDVSADSELLFEGGAPNVAMAGNIVGGGMSATTTNLTEGL